MKAIVVAHGRDSLRLLLQMVPKFAGAGVSVLFLMILSRVLSGTAYGEVGFIITIAALTAQLGNLGQKYVVLARVPGLLASTRGSEARHQIDVSSAIALAGAIVFGAIASFGVAVLPIRAVAGMSGVEMLCAAALIFAQGCMEFGAQVLRSIGRGDLSVYLREVAPRFSALVLMALAGIVLGKTSGAAGLLTFLAISTLLSALGSIFACWHSLPAPSRSLAWKEVLSAIPPGMRYLVHVLFATLREYLDVLVVGLVGGPASVAVYFTLSRLANFVTLPSIALGINAVVDIGASFGTNQRKHALKQVKHLFIRSAIISIPLSIILYSSSELLMKIFNQDITVHDTLVILVSLNYAIVGSTASLWEIIQISGMSRKFNQVFAATVSLGGVGMYFAGLRFGTTGVAFVTLTATSIWVSFGIYELFRGDRT